MGDLIIVPSQVYADDASAAIDYGMAGESIEAGEQLYLDEDTGWWMLFSCNDVTTMEETKLGLALNTASALQPVNVLRSGIAYMGAGAAPAVGAIFVASSNLGGIAKSEDIATGWNVAVLGVGIPGNGIEYRPHNSQQPAIALTDAIFGIGDSFMGNTGSAYGLTTVELMDGRFAEYDKSGLSYPGQSLGTVRTQLAAQTQAIRRSVVVIEGGRNGILTQPAQVRLDALGIMADLAADGNNRYVFCKIPLKPSETIGDDYDAVVAYNDWLVDTLGAHRVIDCETLAQEYPSGDGTHITSPGYDIWAIMMSDAIAALGYLDTGLPTIPARFSVNLDAIGKYVWWTVPAAAYDFLPKLPANTSQTWSVWYKGTGSGYLLGRNGNTVSTARLGIRSSSGTYFGFGGAGIFTSDADDPSDGNWHLCTLTIRNVSGVYKMDLYLDGVAQGTQLTTGALSTTYDVRMGETSEGSAFGAQGKYYQPLMWDAGLTPAEVLTLYNAGVPLAPADCPQAASIVSCLDFENIRAYAVSRGIPDRAGKNDARATGFTVADLSSDIP